MNHKLYRFNNFSFELRGLGGSEMHLKIVPHTLKQKSFSIHWNFILHRRYPFLQHLNSLKKCMSLTAGNFIFECCDLVKTSNCLTKFGLARVSLKKLEYSLTTNEQLNRKFYDSFHYASKRLNHFLWRMISANYYGSFMPSSSYGGIFFDSVHLFRLWKMSWKRGIFDIRMNSTKINFIFVA